LAWWSNINRVSLAWCVPKTVDTRRPTRKLALQMCQCERMGEAGPEEGSEFGFGKSHAVGVSAFRGEVGVEHCGVIGRESDGDAVAEKLRKRVSFDCGGRLRELASESAGEDVAARAEFEGNAAVGEKIHQRPIVDGGDAVADPFDAEEFDGFADFFRTANFAGVHEAMKTQRSGGIIDGTKRNGRNAQFIAAYAEGDDFF